MPPIIKKQIKRARKADSVSGYIKLVPLLFFVGFLILGWLVSFAALKLFKPASGTNNSCVSGISAVLAGEGGEGGEGGACSCESCAASCGSACAADAASCGSSGPGDEGCGEGCGDSCGESCGESCKGCWN